MELVVKAEPGRSTLRFLKKHGDKVVALVLVLRLERHQVVLLRHYDLKKVDLPPLVVKHL